MSGDETKRGYSPAFLSNLADCKRALESMRGQYSPDVVAGVEEMVREMEATPPWTPEELIAEMDDLTRRISAKAAARAAEERPSAGPNDPPPWYPAGFVEEVEAIKREMEARGVPPPHGWPWIESPSHFLAVVEKIKRDLRAMPKLGESLCHRFMEFLWSSDHRPSGLNAEELIRVQRGP